LIKATIPDQLLVEWFTKSLLPPIARDVAMGGVVTEEEAIAHAQYLDLVYSQYGTLYELIPNTPRTSTNPSKPSSTTHSDGVISSVKTQSGSQSTAQPIIQSLPQLLGHSTLIKIHPNSSI
jgi:hypothetical protein